jgi:hypothetical protein
VFEDCELKGAGDFFVDSPLQFEHLIDKWRPDLIVMENYRVYGHRAQQHIGSEVPTIQYIGAIKYLALARNIPIVLQMAFQGKAFAKDDRLQKLGLWHTSKHARDAIRHGIYYYMFGKPAS